jgi:ATP-dependent RNA helicase RhlE
VPEDYVHRTGRTGRAGATGEAVSLVSRDDRPLLGAIEKFTGKQIERAVIAGLEPVVIEHPAATQRAAKPGAGPQRQRQGQRQQRRGGAPGHKPHSKPSHHAGDSSRPAHAPRPAAAGPLDDHRPAFLMRKAATH